MTRDSTIAAVVISSLSLIIVAVSFVMSSRFNKRERSFCEKLDKLQQKGKQA